MNTPVFFESAGDERSTPQAFFDALNAEFHFDIDVAADERNHKCELWFGHGGIAYDAIVEDWAGMTCFLNPPYSAAGAFVTKAREEADKGATVVMLLPVRSDTRWWHRAIWDKSVWSRGQQVEHARQGFPPPPNTEPDGDWRPGVCGRFIAGRLNFELKVPDDIRAWIKMEMATIPIWTIPTPTSEKERIEKIRQLVAVTGLPKMAIERILNDMPDEDLMESAPFPSCVIIFTKAG
jgi:phage N-6-adenine-methyltransferase